MKKFLTLFIVASMAVAISACGNKDNTDESLVETNDSVVTADDIPESKGEVATIDLTVPVATSETSASDDIGYVRECTDIPNSLMREPAWKLYTESDFYTDDLIFESRFDGERYIIEYMTDSLHHCIMYDQIMCTVTVMDRDSFEELLYISEESKFFGE